MRSPAGGGAWSGRILLDDQGGLFVGQGGDTPLHAHHAFKLVIPLDEEVQVQSAARGALRGPLIVVGPNEPHAVLACDRRVALVFVEPQSLLGRSLAAHQEQSASGWTALQAETLTTRLWDSPPGTLPDLAAVLGGVLGPFPPMPLDPRVQSVAIRLDREPSAVERIPELASAVGLSPGRLTHLFAERLGISVVRYRRWRHLRLAMSDLAAGL